MQQQQSQPLRQQGDIATAPGNATSFGVNIPGELYEMPREEIRQSRGTHCGTSESFDRLCMCTV